MKRRAPYFVALLVFLVAAGFYLALPSSRLNPDGLRVFPGLHRVTVDSTGRAGFVRNGWFAGYQAPHYERANVQKHFLFSIYAVAVDRLARGFGYSGSGLKPLLIANAASAAFVAGLFALMVGLLSGSPWTALATGFGLVFSTAFSSMATTIAEVVPALPWLMLAMILLVSEEDLRPVRTTCVGLLIGISAAFYFVSAAIGAALAVYLALRRTPARALLMAGTMVVTAGAIYVLVLLLAGYHTLPQLGRALFFMPEQGTYGGLKPSNLVSVWLGFAGSIFPVLPSNFSGLHSLLTRTAAGYRFFPSVVLLSLAVPLGAALLVALFRARKHLAPRVRRSIGLGLALFTISLVVSLVWDPYHLKLWTYSNIGLWLMIAGYLAHVHEARCRAFEQRALTLRSGIAPWSVLAPEMLTTLVLFCVVSANLARRALDAGPDPKWRAAQAIAQIVNAAPGNVVLGGWEPEFDYLTLLVPESNQVSLPDVILEQGRDSARFADFAAATLVAAKDRNGSVFFLNLFNQSSGELDAFYARRLMFPAIIPWLQGLRPQAQEIWANPETRIHLYRLAAVTSQR